MAWIDFVESGKASDFVMDDAELTRYIDAAQPQTIIYTRIKTPLYAALMTSRKISALSHQL
eukprot:scaffold669910_cov62-Prasinocladus_malaysianus.AAC.1